LKVIDSQPLTEIIPPALSINSPHIHNMAPSSTRQWKVEGKDGFDSLKFEEKASIPELGDKDVLVKSTCFLPSHSM
jgi:hypothetical protein